MAAFEFEGRSHLGPDGRNPLRGITAAPAETGTANVEKHKPIPLIKDECILAFKVYDQFRLQDCLTEDEIGPARAAETKTVEDHEYREDEIIEPPANAAAVSIDELKVEKIFVVNKTPNSFKNGYWDIELKLVIEYELTFRGTKGGKMHSVKARNIVNKKVSMFGSIKSDIAIGTDFFPNDNGETWLIPAEPYIQVEAKGVALAAELKYHRRRSGCEDAQHHPNRVAVTIGMFCIVQLFRVVDLNVQSKGFCIPPEREDPDPVNACDFFENLDFPMDIFAPPQKKEFKDGISTNISREKLIGAEPCDC